MNKYATVAPGLDVFGQRVEPLRALELGLPVGLVVTIDRVDLEHVLGDIDADSRNLHPGLLLVL